VYSGESLGALTTVRVRFLDQRVARVKITNGNTVLGPSERRDRDLVVMDDFIFGTPTPLDSAAGLHGGVAGLRPARSPAISRKVHEAL
jgi:hypothetical protein